MARPIKHGIEYFSLDTDFFGDRKIRRLLRLFGAKGVAVFVFLLCEVYRDKGYYAVWDEDFAFDIADSIGNGVTDQLVKEIINNCVKSGLFDAKLFKQNIISSRGIQKRFLKAKERSKGKIDEYSLVNVAKTRVNVTETRVNVAETPENVTISTQTKRNETKVNESKRKKNKTNETKEDISGYIRSSAESAESSKSSFGDLQSKKTDFIKSQLLNKKFKPVDGVVRTMQIKEIDRIIDKNEVNRLLKYLFYTQMRYRQKKVKAFASYFCFLVESKSSIPDDLEDEFNRKIRNIGR
jgi:hypothetical protein